MAAYRKNNSKDVVIDYVVIILLCIAITAAVIYASAILDDPIYLLGLMPVGFSIILVSLASLAFPRVLGWINGRIIDFKPGERFEAKSYFVRYFVAALYLLVLSDISTLYGLFIEDEIGGLVWYSIMDCIFLACITWLLLWGGNLGVTGIVIEKNFLQATGRGRSSLIPGTATFTERRRSIFIRYITVRGEWNIEKVDFQGSRSFSRKQTYINIDPAIYGTVGRKEIIKILENSSLLDEKGRN